MWPLLRPKKTQVALLVAIFVASGVLYMGLAYSYLSGEALRHKYETPRATQQEAVPEKRQQNLLLSDPRPRGHRPAENGQGIAHVDLSSKIVPDHTLAHVFAQTAVSQEERTPSKHSPPIITPKASVSPVIQLMRSQILEQLPRPRNAPAHGSAHATYTIFSSGNAPAANSASSKTGVPAQGSPTASETLHVPNDVPAMGNVQLPANASGPASPLVSIPGNRDVLPKTSVPRNAPSVASVLRNAPAIASIPRNVLDQSIAPARVPVITAPELGNPSGIASVYSIAPSVITSLPQKSERLRVDVAPGMVTAPAPSINTLPGVAPQPEFTSVPGFAQGSASRFAPELEIAQTIASAPGVASKQDFVTVQGIGNPPEIDPAQIPSDVDSIFSPPGSNPELVGLDSNPSGSSPSPSDPGIDLACAHMVYGERRERADNICLKQRDGDVRQLLHYGNVSYCMVPKVGCTFWMNVFRYLHNDTAGIQYPTPLDIPRVITHYGPRKNVMFYKMNFNSTPQHLLTDFRFMFVREPWSRLWSAYLDKFLLIDFWFTDGQDIVKRRKVKVPTTKCARDISFKEFVDFVVSTPPQYQNPHWRPVQYQCSPCLYRPHVIGKIETFSQDSRFLLDKVGLTWILDNYTHDAHVHGEMDMLIDYNFGIFQKKFFRACTNTTDLAYRLWVTFQYNGYLPMEAPFPEVNVPRISVTHLKTLVHSAYTNRPAASPQQWRRQRDKAMIDAYKEIPPENIVKLQQLYQSDFDLFGYDATPPGSSGYERAHGEPSCIIK